MQLTLKTKKIISFFRLKMGIDLLKAPCFSCPIEKRGYPCLDPKSCDLLLKWLDKVGEKS